MVLRSVSAMADQMAPLTAGYSDHPKVHLTVYQMAHQWGRTMAALKEYSTAGGTAPQLAYKKVDQMALLTVD